MEGVQRQRRRRTIATVVVAVVIIVIVVGSIYALTQNQTELRQVVPASVGIEGSCIHPIHTHDASGTIHVETDEDRSYTLGDFFLLWGKVFNSSGVFPSSQTLPAYLSRCVSATLLYHSHPTLTIIFKKDAPSKITMTVNGNSEPLFQNYVFPRDTVTAPSSIVITYGPGVPASF